MTGQPQARRCSLWFKICPFFDICYFLPKTLNIFYSLYIQLTYNQSHRLLSNAKRSHKIRSSMRFCSFISNKLNFLIYHSVCNNTPSTLKICHHKENYFKTKQTTTLYFPLANTCFSSKYLFEIN